MTAQSSLPSTQKVVPPIPPRDDGDVQTPENEEADARDPMERFFWGVEGDGDVRVIYDPVTDKRKDGPERRQ